MCGSYLNPLMISQSDDRLHRTLTVARLTHDHCPPMGLQLRASTSAADAE